MKKLLLAILVMAISMSVNAQMLIPNSAEERDHSIFNHSSGATLFEKEDAVGLVDEVERGPGDPGGEPGGGGDSPIGGAVLPLAVCAGVYLFVRRKPCRSLSLWDFWTEKLYVILFNSGTVVINYVNGFHFCL